MLEPTITTSRGSSRDEVARTLAAVRRSTLELVAPLSDETLERPLHPLLSPLAWDLAHIAAYEDLWCVHHLGSRPLLLRELAGVYDAFETPRARRGEASILDRYHAVAYLEAVRERTLEVLDALGPHDFHELVLQHELQHVETMRQALFVSGLPGGLPAGQPAFAKQPKWIAIPAGPFEMGAAHDGFAYDNERSAHPVHVGEFAIAHTPVTNDAWLSFCEEDGYSCREWWSDEGWEWRQSSCASAPERFAPRALNLAAPVMHVSAWEAEAYARSQGARLPTEAEWEKAAQQPGALAGVGNVWEWTQTEFSGYPGFVADPYPEYSQVFFDRGYRVLRGGSWATSSRVASPTFRNWDLPQRRQIFSGVRLATDS